MNRLRQRTIFFSVLAIAVVLLTACGSVLQSEPSSKGSDHSGANEPGAADFAITVYQGQDLLGGEEVDFSDLLEQGKPVVLNLWAGLCPPCRLEMPDFQEVNAEFGDEVLLLGLDVGPFTNLGSSEDGKALIQELGVTYPVGTTPDAGVVRDYQLLGMPTTYFISPEGEIVNRWTGLLTRDKLAELVEVLIEESGVANE